MVGRHWNLPRRMDLFSSSDNTKNTNVLEEMIDIDLSWYSIGKAMYLNAVDRTELSKKVHIDTRDYSTYTYHRSQLTIKLNVKSHETIQSRYGLCERRVIRRGNFKTQTVTLITYFQVTIEQSELLLSKKEFYEKYGNPNIRKAYDRTHRSAIRRSLYTKEHALNKLLACNPIRNDLPTKRANMLLRGMLEPVNTMDIITIVSDATILLGNQKALRRKPTRFKSRYTSYTGAKVLLHWASKSKRFREYLMVYVPWITEEKIKAYEVMGAVSKDEVPEWLKK